MEAALERGQEPPEWYWEEPGELPGDLFYFEAFRILSTCRQMGAMVAGNIPWDKILKYGRHMKLEPRVLNAFVNIIMEMDTVYLEWHSQKMDKPGRTDG